MDSWIWGGVACAASLRHRGGMNARFGQVLYWFSWVIAAPFALLGCVAIGGPTPGFPVVMFAAAAGIVLLGRSARYVLAGG